ncbi:MAG: hypothetical protein KI790_15480 [Cyclobacteriaceae bacterium]|nr:hypothetical protein [Cyclobacteriaceae bacterium HetDA_MAG_MS6]
MKRSLNIDRILLFNDFPELFLAKDSLGVDYICLLYDFSDEEYSYLCVGVSKKVLHSFLNGYRDLRSIFSEPEAKEWWTTKDASEPKILIQLLEIEKVPGELLPEEGFFFNDEQQDEFIRNEVVEHNNVIVHLSLSDENENQSIPIDDLGDFSKLYQLMVEKAYKKAILRSELKEKKSFIVPNNYTLRAFAASPGSFNLHLKSEANKDLFGNSIIEEGLSMIDQVINSSDDEEKLIESLRSIKGHAISSYKKLLEKVVNRKVNFKYKWVSPASPEIHKRQISTDYAEKVIKLLETKEELAEEIKVFIGFIMQADVEKGGWRITNEEDGKDYSGESAGHLLEGITLETVKYKLTCQEIVEALKVTEKEKVKYVLTQIEELK